MNAPFRTLSCTSSFSPFSSATNRLTFSSSVSVWEVVASAMAVVLVGWVVVFWALVSGGGLLGFLGHSLDMCPWASQWKHHPSFFSFSWCSVRGRLVCTASTSIGTELSLDLFFSATFHCCFLSFLSFGDLVSPRFFLITYCLFSSCPAACHWWMVSGHFDRFMQAWASLYGRPWRKRGMRPLASSFRSAKWDSRLNLATYWSRFPSFMWRFCSLLSASSLSEVSV